MSKRQTLESWIAEAIAEANSNNEAVSAISLVHMRGAGEVELHTTRFGGKAWTAKDLAEMFQGRADSYAQDLPGVQTFCVYVFYETSASEIRARHPFTANGVTDYGGLMTEGPDERGMRQQGMRLTEAIVVNTFRQITTVFQASQNTVQQQGQEIRELRAENREMFIMVKDMLVERDRNEHERAMKRLEFERSTEERKKWLTFVPPLVNQVLGREVFPQNVEDTALVEGIAEELSKKPEDMMKLAAIIPPSMMGPLAGRMQKYDEDKAKKTAMIPG